MNAKATSTAGKAGEHDDARERYRSALAIVDGAPDGCFANNTDPDTERRAVRNDTVPRLLAKLDGLDDIRQSRHRRRRLPRRRLLRAPPPAIGTGEPEGQPGELRLDPGNGDPDDKLRQILQDAAG